MKYPALLFVLMATLAAAAPVCFEDVTKRAGLIQPLLGIMGHGGAWGDFDGDGHIDLYVGGFADRPDEGYAPAKGPVANQLLRNLGNGKFVPVKNTPASHYARTSGAMFADLDNDGDLELYVGNNARPGRVGGTTGPQRAARLAFSRLYRNDGGKLVDISDASGACPKTLETGRNIGVLDYDLDGRLDLLLIEDGFTRGPSSRLFRNLGGLKFKDVTTQAGLPEDLFGLGCAIADVNGDDRPDIFVAHSNRFFLSSGNGKYRESAELKKTFAWKPLHNEDWPCGVAFGDLNNDGRLDLVLGIHCETSRNRVFLNVGMVQGVPRFRDVTAAAGLPAHLPQKAPHVEIQDFDNDGRSDIFFSAGVLRDGKVTPLICRNTSVKNKVPQFTLSLPPGQVKDYFAASPSGDFDNDGRIDLCLVNWFRGNHTRLLRNVSAKKNWLQIRVRGQRMNRMGIGAKITVWESPRKRRHPFRLGYQEIATGYGYASGQPAIAHFGLGDTTRVMIDVQFPGEKKSSSKMSPPTNAF